jgi:hypothetical protein
MVRFREDYECRKHTNLTGGMEEFAMNWDAIGAVGELLGSATVLVTLVYLARQVRYARNEGRRAISQGRIEALRDLTALALEERNFEAVQKANELFGFGPTPGSWGSTMIERGMSVDEMRRVLLQEVAHWGYAVHVITHADELQAEELTQFSNWLKLRYGTPGISRFIYETGLKGSSHPATIRGFEKLMEQAADPVRPDEMP